MLIEKNLSKFYNFIVLNNAIEINPVVQVISVKDNLLFFAKTGINYFFSKDIEKLKFSMVE